MRVLLLSTYELGHQPFALATIRARLRAAGHETRAVDVAVSPLPSGDLQWAEALVISVPMHTALRLALEVVHRARQLCPALPIALCGLYAPVAETSELLRGTDLLVAGDPGPALLGWLGGGQDTADPGGGQGPGGGQDTAGTAGGQGTAGPGPRSVTEIGYPVSRRAPSAAAAAAATAAATAAAAAPLRDDLEPLERYATLVTGATKRLVGSTLSSHGCNHRCRHCPVAAVYGGRSRPIALEAVLGDVAQLVDAGATHINFGDPDFLNRPRHALEVAEAVHASWPELSFDATVKVEHVIRHEQLWRHLRELGLNFVVSAFESTDDEVLRLLDKGHTAADEALALSVLRQAGIEARPSWLPFSPWTTLSSLADLLRFSAEHDLVSSTDTVQYSIRLLLPAHSLLLDHPDPVLAASLGELDASNGTWSWSPLDPSLDELQAALTEIAEAAAENEVGAEAAFGQVWEAARGGGVPLEAEPPPVAWPSPLAGPERPHLSEAWFCCAEPTRSQHAAVATPSR
ncbi:MAG: radical SAM protein [Acidimicrobiales bacterium]